jgi:hypothetical protein
MDKKLTYRNNLHIIDIGYFEIEGSRIFTEGYEASLVASGMYNFYPLCENILPFGNFS